MPALAADNPPDCHCDSGLEAELLLVRDTIWNKAFITSPMVFRTMLKACSCWKEEVPEHHCSPHRQEADISGSWSRRDSLKFGFVLAVERRKIRLLLRQCVLLDHSFISVQRRCRVKEQMVLWDCCCCYSMNLSQPIDLQNSTKCEWCS